MILNDWLFDNIKMFPLKPEIWEWWGIFIKDPVRTGELHYDF